MKKSIVGFLVLLTGCATPFMCRAQQTEPLSMEPLFQYNPTDPADLSEQTRLYPTRDRESVLLASAAALQDMGFNVTGGEKRFGLLVGSKKADVEDPGAGHAMAEAAVVTLSIMASLLTGEDLVTDLPEQIGQEIHVSLLISEAGNRDATQVRISLDRDMIYDQGYSRPDHTELPMVYREFFERLSRAIYLEGERL
jgi:hypothetical protein